jgi:hypothetical protein
MAKAESFIIYRGPSLIDGEPIVAIAQVSSRNAKTGSMVQTFIMRADMDPITANRTGADHAICGTCPHRGKAHDGDKGTAKDRTCYVTLAHGPLQKWKGLQRGLYPDAVGHEAIKAIGAGRMVRIGTYGDGAAVPSYIWESLIEDAKGWTAYTHQNGVASADTSAKLYMTSAESKGQAAEAWMRGERTFRVIADVADMDKKREFLCPASEEMGKRVQCDKCGLCAGNSVKAKSVAIVAHGGAKRKAKELVAA